ncbi:DNA-directed RNA polymerase subunit beta' [Pelolinea submarina]|uniref:DNA-directed RNA polymerase subunit beta' n=1 Tax=Pelolinea submarina TaxID=913107 RepID=A0A3E0AHE5_9CHLR|nr:DNA-directed RNA polymerase subunit beta' [Pelolinea submarina]
METKSLVALRISLASPDTIRSWSYGEVTKPETINYRRLRPEKDGLFCEAIFGPTRDYQCYCGKYKNPRYKGIVCDKCGVEVTRSSVRRERMGHIELASPVAHIWYTRRVPSYLGLLLNISRRNLDRVLYFAQYIVTFVDEDAKQKVLNRLEDEVADADHDEMGNLEARIKEIQAARDVEIQELADQKKELEGKVDELIGQRMDPIIKEGQALEQKIQEKEGSAIRKDMVFESAEVTILKAGEVIDAKLLSVVQDAVKGKLEEVENEVRSQIEDDMAKVDVGIEKVRAEADLNIANLSEQLGDIRLEVKSKIDQQRDELEDLAPFKFLSENQYRDLKSRYGQVFRAEMGAEAFVDILSRLDLDQLAQDLWLEVKTTKSKQKRKKSTTRLKVVEAFRRSKNRPEWMILSVLPVIPPDLRPMVQLDGGRFATSDLNDLYRRVINRNNRLKRLLELGAPDVIVRNEKRMLQEAVDSLIDNSQRGKALSRRGRRELKSLSDMLKGKKGRFRRNLLGKRVDYSGRSVIVVGPKLKLYQCGLPKTMALELYRPFVIAGLVKKNYAANVKGARRLMERNRPEVWEVLEEVIGDRPVLLNRAPTLHRLGIQAFEPVLIEGSAIQLHPLVTTAFNADFDGDQMAVHVPLSEKAVWEARNLMLASKNLLKPADGEPIISPSKDMVLGVYYLTREPRKEYTGKEPAYSTFDEVDMAFRLNQVKVATQIRLQVKTWFDEAGKRMAEPETRVINTTVGRVLFNYILPPEIQFYNDMLEKGRIKSLIAEIYDLCGEEVTTDVADKIKDIGFEYAMLSGTTLSVADITVPEEKKGILADSNAAVEEVQKSFRRGRLTEQEMNERVIDIWQETTRVVGEAVRASMDPTGNLSTMANSGATKGGFGPISQLAGMRGLMADPSGRIIRLPIQSNFREGLTALEYFISTHGARKGLADTALRTADAGYLTRRLVDVAQDMIINEEDCETNDGIWIRKGDDIAGQSLESRLYGRIAGSNIVDPKTGEIIVERNQMLSNADLAKIVEAGVEEVFVRSPLTCELKHGLCQKCYGMDLGRGKLVEKGTAVGTIAAQSIGEPGTQLTLRTFHTGGVAAGSDITTGLPRVEELFEARRMPKGEAVMCTITGTATVIPADSSNELNRVKVEHSELIQDEYAIPEGWEIKVTDEQELKEAEVIAANEDATIIAQHGGRIEVKKDKVVVSYDQVETEEFDIPGMLRLIVKNGEKVEAGQALTEGSLNPHTILRIKGREACQLYLLSEIQNVYRAQGQNINDKHFEVIIRKMMSKVQVIRPGDSEFLPMDMVDRMEIRLLNETLRAEGRQPARFIEVLLGVTKASLTTDSWLSASSFQHTIKVLAGAAIAADQDPLFGLKENVIIGKLIPSGTGFSDKRIDTINAMVEVNEHRFDEPVAEEDLEAEAETETAPAPEE